MGKTLTRNGSNISLYKFEDSQHIAQTENDTTVYTGDSSSEIAFIIADCSSNNSTVHTGVTVPDDWYGWKYIYDGTSWSANDTFVDPREE
tara:strand:+ start:339 stop:608 length:270 start_codon:yes stop_codon:yes gene_type:complete